LLGANTNVELEGYGLRIEGWNTDDMRIKDTTGKLPTGAHRTDCKVTIGDQDKLRALASGFEELYMLIESRKPWFESVVQRFEACTTRVILRHTSTYQSLLGYTYSPRVQSNWRARRRIFQKLTPVSHGHWGDTIRHLEIAGLVKGLIPKFVTTPASTSVWSECGREISGVLAETGQQRAIARIASTNRTKLAEHLEEIAMSMAS
jgi:lantibiotic modifying enzyme